MLLVINYANESFRPWQELQTKRAYLFGADKVREYSAKDIDADFYKKNKFILDQKRGAGYWLWKPYIIKDALSTVNDGDYVFYVDSGAFFVSYAPSLIEAMKQHNVDVMTFQLPKEYLEKFWSKRDAFILMDCDSERFADTPQFIASHILFKKTPNTVALVDEYLKYAQDPRIITDIPNQMGKENYPGFRENRHDQTIWSLLCKKKGITTFELPLVFCHHRRFWDMKFWIPALPILIHVAKRLGKDNLPKEFQRVLTVLVEMYIKQYPMPDRMPSAQKVVEDYRQLDIPETPSLRRFCKKLGIKFR